MPLPLDSKEVTYGETTFFINKLMPRAAKKVFMDHMRPMLKGGLEANVDDSANQWQLILALITGAPQAHYDAAVHEMYKNINYTRPNVTVPQPLVNDEDNAFQDLDMVHILLLDVRAFAVNFQGSWSVLTSEYPILNLLIRSLDQKTSTPSSGTPLTPD